MNVGDKVKHRFPPYETGKVVRIDDSKINAYCILVKVNNTNDIQCFKPSHLIVDADGNRIYDE